MTNRDLTRLVVTHVHAVLQPLGFRKAGSNFTRTTADIVHIVHIVQLQKSTGSDAAHIKVTANIAVWAPALAAVPDKPNVADAQWNLRIGQLGPERNDLWWSASNADEARTAGREIAERILAFTRLSRPPRSRSHNWVLFPRLSVSFSYGGRGASAVM